MKHVSSTLEKVKSENEILKEKTKLLEEQMTKQAEQHKEYAKERFKSSFLIGQDFIATYNWSFASDQ